MSNTPIRPTPRKTSGLHRIRKKSRRMAESFTESSLSASMMETEDSSDEEDSPQTSAARSLAFLTNSSSSLQVRQGDLSPAAPPDRQTITCVGRRLHNLLKLPKAYRFCCYEWFYSTIDKPLFESDNDDFSSLLKAYFPNLKTRMLTKAQWGHVRRLMGKPRRCSAAFLAQERRSLEEKRKLIRSLRSNKPMASYNYKNVELPREIPAALTIGTSVTAWLHGSPSENMFGLFTGVVEAIDQANGQYRIRFDRKGLGTHNVQDCDVLSNSRVETMPISPLAAVPHPHEKHSLMFSPFTPGLTPPKMVTGTPGGTSLPRLLNDPHMGAQGVTPIYNSTPIAKQPAPASANGGNNTEMLRGFPMDFLRVVAQLTKVLQFKRERINRLKELNSEAERLDLIQQPRSAEFQQQYSYVLLDLEALNLHLNQTMPQVTMWCGKLNPNSLELPMSIPDACNNRAAQMVNNFNVGSDGAPRVRSNRAVLLITRLVSLLLQLQEASRGNTVNAYELGCIHEALKELKSNPNIVSQSNLSMFENSVEVHIQHIMTGLYQRGSLYQYSMAQAQLQPPPTTQPAQSQSQHTSQPPPPPPPPPVPAAHQQLFPPSQQQRGLQQAAQAPALPPAQPQQQPTSAATVQTASAIGQQVVSSHLASLSMPVLPSIGSGNAPALPQSVDQVQASSQQQQQQQQQPYVTVSAQPGVY